MALLDFVLQREVIVTLAESHITTADLLGLRVGDIITTTKDAQASLDVSVEGLTKYRATPGAFKGQKAFQVEKKIVTDETPPVRSPVPVTS